MSTCPYCCASEDDAWGVTEQAIAVPASDPVTPGHCIIAPRRHVSELYELDAQEQQEVWSLIATVRNRIMAGVNVESFHLGFVESHDGTGHMHVHVVPQPLGETIHLPEQVEWIKT